jgi:hypothetical protein
MLRHYPHRAGFFFTAQIVASASFEKSNTKSWNQLACPFQWAGLGRLG